MEMPAVRIEIGGDHVRLVRYPFETVAEIVHFSRLRNLRLARHRAENKSSTVEKADDALVERHDRRGLVNDRREDVIEIQRGGDLLRDFQERVEYGHFALRLKQIRIVQSNGRLLAHAGEEKKFILV